MIFISIDISIYISIYVHVLGRNMFWTMCSSEEIKSSTYICSIIVAEIQLSRMNHFSIRLMIWQLSRLKVCRRRAIPFKLIFRSRPKSPKYDLLLIEQSHEAIFTNMNLL